MKVGAIIVAFLLAVTGAGPALTQTSGPARLQAAVAGLPRPAAIYVAGRGTPEPWGAAAGVAYPGAGGPITVDTPLRIASNTKTFTAATVLRLWETGRIDLDAPIGPLLSPSLNALLIADGYDTAAITVRHLLSHSSGLYDHGSDQRFVEAVMADPGHHWTREELVWTPLTPMIREVIRTDRMPPYNADPHVGKFSDDRNLSANEIKTLVHWIEAGAPRGEGEDPLGKVQHVAAEWPLGKPDLVLDIPAYKVPASGVVDYQRPFTPNSLTEGRWIRASTVKPGDRQAVHHILTGWMKDVPAAGQNSSETRWRGSVGGYAVGAESNVFSEEVGTYLPAGGAVGYQMHYTPYGKETVDKSQIGVYFRDTVPKYIMRGVVVIDTSLEIAPNTARHKEVAYVEFPKDALLYSAFPHAHYRAYSNDLWLQTPDGKKTLLLSMPRYDFNWQRSYTFAQPVKIPAGSRLIANYIYDNSKANPSNPDPNIKVTWGEQSHEEMLFTSLSFRWMDETAAEQIDSEARFAQTRLLGMMDDNIDGKLQKTELRGRMGAMISGAFAMLDKNGDQSLDRAELVAAQAMMGRRRGTQATTTDGPSASTPFGS